MKAIMDYIQKIWASPAQRVILLIFTALNVLLMVFSVPEGPYAAGADVAVSLEPARSLLEGAGFVHPGGEPYTWGTPLYPIFLAAFIGLFPWKIALYVIVAMQCLLLYATGLMVRNITAAFSPKAAALAQGILILNPNMLITAHLLQTEILFTFLLTAGVLVMLGFAQNPAWVRAAGCGLLCGLATMVRPVGQFIVLLLPMFFGVIGLGGKRGFFYRALVAGILALVMAVLVVSPWVLRNHNRFRSFFLTSNAGYYLEDQYRQLLHNGYGLSDSDTQAAATASTNQYLAYLRLDFEKMKNLPKYRRSQILAAAHLKAFLSVPIPIHSKAMLESLVQLYFTGGASNICNYLGIKGEQAIVQFQKENRSTVMDAVSRFFTRIDWGYASLLLLTFAYTIIMRLAGVIGLMKMFRTGMRTRTLVILMVMATLTLSYLYLGQSRFRVPLEPYLALMAALGWLGVKSALWVTEYEKGNNNRIESYSRH